MGFGSLPQETDLLIKRCHQKSLLKIIFRLTDYLFSKFKTKRFQIHGLLNHFLIFPTGIRKYVVICFFPASPHGHLILAIYG